MNKRKRRVINDNKNLKLSNKTYLYRTLQNVMIFVCSYLFITAFIYILSDIRDLDFHYRAFVSSLLASFLLLILFLYLKNAKSHLKNKEVVLLYIIMYLIILVSLFFQKLVSPFIVPILTVTICVFLLIGRTIALVSSLILSSVLMIISFTLFLKTEIFLEIISANILSMIIASFMIFITPKNVTRFKLIWGGILLSLCMMPIAIILGYLLKRNLKESLFIASFNLLGNILGVIIYTGLIPLIEYVFRIWTNLKLAEISSFDQPLLKKLAKEAPGTFQHSLGVGNMAELCAIAIGENPYMARIAGYYHDIGKLRNPEYFIENQIDGENPHNDLIPDISVKIITRHTVDGYNVLKKSRMPDLISRAALEHHGTSKVMYFFNKAQSYTEGLLDSELYRYNNPTPTSKISVIITLCDVLEATSRAKIMTIEEMSEFITNVIKNKIDEKQFINSDITFKELEIIKRTLISIIPSIRHKRIDYNKKEY